MTSPHVSRCILLLLLLTASSLGLWHAQAADSDKDPAAVFEPAVGKAIDVTLKSGNIIENAKLLELVKDAKTGLIRVLVLAPEGSTQNRRVTIAGIRLATLEGKSIYALDTPGEKSPPRKSTLKTKEERDAAEAARQEEEHQQWLARLKARGVRPWPELSDEQHQQTIDEHKEMMKQVDKLFPGMQFAETDNFMVYTNIPIPQMQPFVVSLDKMHEMMCKMYAIPTDSRVFRGKAIIFAFLEKPQFVKFEQTIMKTDPGGAYGICHQSSNGKVVVGCYRGDRATSFGSMLVHETSHGFIHRYQTPVRLPSWMNEGMADYIAAVLVPASSGQLRREQKQALEKMKQTRNLLGTYFGAARINFDQYGVASSMTEFLIRTNARAYAQMVGDLKEGMPFDEALQKNYAATPEQLTTAIGAAIGIPDLKE